MPGRRRIYILRIEDYLLDPPSPPSKAPKIILYTACGILLLANLVLAFGWLFSVIPPAVFEIAIAGVIAYTIILALFVALSRSIHHVE
jgi:hypothetical protein